jgi:pSer/pThr/pTyr-binding forkhead associated (FHA) protein
VQSPATIGRDPSSTIRLDDAWVDMTHARLRQGPNGQWEIADAESLGVTKRNGEVLRPNEWVAVTDGDILTIGFVDLAYVTSRLSLPSQFGAIRPSTPSPEVPQVSGHRPSAPSRDRRVSEMPAFGPAPQQPASMPTPSRRGRLSVSRGPIPGTAVELQGITIVGNLPGFCALVIPDQRVAPRHVEISRHPDGFYVRDLGTATGTVHRGRILGAAPVKLAHGDTLTLGAAVELLFEGPA